MWQALGPKMRSAATAKTRQRDRRPLHIKVVSAQLKLLSAMPEQSGPAAGPVGQNDGTMEVRVLLNDFSPKGMGLFSSDPIIVGQEVAITFEHPRRIYLRGRVIWCQEYDRDRRIISAQTFSYRMGVQFRFDSKDEEKAVKDFCDHLGKEYLYTSKVA